MLAQTRAKCLRLRRAEARVEARRLAEREGPTPLAHKHLVKPRWAPSIVSCRAAATIEPNWWTAKAKSQCCGAVVRRAAAETGAVRALCRGQPRGSTRPPRRQVSTHNSSRRSHLVQGRPQRQVGPPLENKCSSMRRRRGKPRRGGGLMRETVAVQVRVRVRVRIRVGLS